MLPQAENNFKLHTMFLELPVLYWPDGYDPEEAENLYGKDVEVELKAGTMDINTAHICAYNEMDNGNTLLRLSNGDVIECPIEYQSFKENLAKTECLVSIMTSNDN
jgi:hypothetical protein